ncbi:FAD/NAD(P)-binding domain-containing protein [Setomelanomma holmii]|uniref:FAD/NAD(P)-binding domain-containing protein n=1 Tax=Setomelanomma holmii TaxID=210430 RepID=A0A9P4LK74_9PLEO|nr:FAD/NAD(P)-binding domain-containing protein [Setomelanomma holmii]
MATQTPGFRDVIVVGAGPAGLLLALFLAQSNIPVTIIDQSPDLDQGARATHYAAPAMWELNRAGVGDDMREQGFHPDGVCWRKLDGSPIAAMDSTVMKDDPDDMVCLPLSKLQQTLRNHLTKHDGAKIIFNYNVVGLGQSDERAWVDIDTPEGKKRLEADYIVGCDGANSQIRRSLFGDWEFPGRTWDEQIVATNTYYNFEPYKWNDCNFIVDPEHWFMAAKIGKDGMYRITYGEKPGFTTEQLRERLQEKFKTMLPGHPEPSEYKVANFAPYKVHQRLAKSMRVGRFLLAADAAHLCNPFGGMGLTGGIVDVGGLYDCLRGIYENKADASILDKYSEVRRKIYLDIIDVVSSANIRRLFALDPDRAVEQDDFFQLVKRAEGDAEFSKQLQNGMRAIQHDFTQYYGKNAPREKSDFAKPPVAVVPPSAA